MQWRQFDLSPRSWGRVVLFTILGTLFCIVAAYSIDSYSIATGTWAWGRNPRNNLIIPLVLAPPFFIYLLSQLRQLALAHQALTVVASLDGLTACLNRRAFTALVEAYLERAVRLELKAQGALLILDADHFKAVNDRFGHVWGDEALKIIAESVKLAVRDIDLVGRLGGEEFGVFLPGLPPDQCEAVAERIRAAVENADFFPRERRHGLSVSVGGATFARVASFRDLFRLADQWLYFAKRGGRNRVEVHDASAGDPPYTAAGDPGAQPMFH